MQRTTPQASSRRRAFAAALSSLGILLAGQSAHAADQTYDDTNLSNVWDLTTSNWDASAALWTNGNNAVFGGTGESIAINGAITVGNMTFNSTGYTLAAGTGSLTLLAGTDTVSIGSGNTATISAAIGGTGTLTKSGAGTLTLSGANTFTGGTTVSAGTLLIGNAAGAGTGTVTLNGGTFGASGAQTITNKVSVLTGNSAIIGGGTGTLTLGGTLTGGGALQLTTNTLVINGNVASAFTGSITSGVEIQTTSANNAVPGTLNLSNAAITLQSGGGFRWSTGGSTAQTATFALGSLSGTAGTLGLSSGSNKTDAFVIGSLNTDTTYGGTIINGNSGASSPTSVSKVGSGTLILNGAATSNTMTGGITVRGGTLQVGDGTSTVGGFSTSSNALTFKDSGRFNYQGSSSGSSQGMGALTFTQGAGTVQSTYGTSGNTALTFASLAARATGATGNFVVSGGTNGTTNKIVFTAAPTLSTSGIMDKGLFFGGSNYAAYDATGLYVRAYTAGDANYVTATGSNAITSTSTDNVALTGNVTAQASAGINTLNMGTNTLALASGGAFTTNGILVSGNNAATISGGTSLAATTSAGELVIRVDGASDALTISTPVIANSTAALTKTGAGTLTLSGTNTYTGATNVDEGTLTLSGANTVNTGSVTVNNGASLNVSAAFSTTGVVTVANGSGNGILNVNSGGTLTLTNTLLISNSATGADAGSGTVNVNNGGTISTNNDITVGLGGTQTGTMNIASGATVNIGTTTLRWFKLGQFDSANGVVNLNGGTLNLDFNSDIRFGVNGGGGTSVFNQNAGNVTVWSGNGTGTTGSASDGHIDMQVASSTTADNTYNLNGGTLTVNQVKSTVTTGTRTFNFNGGTLQARSASAATFFNLGAGNARANVRNGGAIINTNGFNVTVAQGLLHSNVSGDNATDGGVTKNGTGTLTLTGTNTYTGATTVNAGTLALGASNILADSSNVVLGGGTLAAATFSDTIGTLSLTANSSITVGSGGSLVFADSSSLDWGSNTLSISGTFTDSLSIRFGTSGSGLTSAQLALISINGSSAFLDSSGFLTTSAVPEPATYAVLAGLGVLGLAVYRRRRNA